MANPTLIAEAQAYGFRVHQGTDGELAGRWWWTLYRDGWSEAECCPDDFGSEDEAWNSSIVAHASELMEA